MKRIHTQKGSVYEVDEELQLVRRVAGKRADFAWSNYTQAHIGVRLIVTWTSGKYMVTSVIERVEEVLL